MMKALEHLLEVLVFNSRWLLAPFYLGLVVGIGMLLVKFGQEFLHILPHVVEMQEADLILAILTLVDMSLVASLLLIIVFSGYENFVSKIDTAGHEDRPSWMGKVDFSGLKMKVIASIVAISAIELLKAFVHMGLDTGASEPMSWTNADTALSWKIGIHFVLVVSGVLFALMDRIAEGGHATKSPH
ncbi:MAG TPA: TIGR00645 family protein [Gammaproteobacteria bacterium]